MPDEKDLHDPRNPCYDDEPKKLFISKPKYPKLATSTTDRDETIENKPLPHFKEEEITFNDGSKGTVSWIPMPELDYKDELIIGKGIKAALNDTSEPIYKKSNVTIQFFEDLINSKPNKNNESNTNNTGAGK